MEKFYPDVYQKSIYTINYEKLKENGIKCLLFDLDNTCVPYVDKLPSKKLKNLFEDLQDLGFKIIIFSNSNKKRLEPFKKELSVDCCPNAKKPWKKSFLKVLNKFNFELSQVAIIGDQFYTDIWGGSRVGITTVLVNPVSNTDMFFTRFARKMENRLLRKMAKENIFKKGRYYD